MPKELAELSVWDYVFLIPANMAVQITSLYEDGNYLTCAYAAIKEYPESYRIATEEEIKASKKAKKEFVENIRNIAKYWSNKS